MVKSVVGVRITAGTMMAPFRFPRVLAFVRCYEA